MKQDMINIYALIRSAKKQFQHNNKICIACINEILENLWHEKCNFDLLKECIDLFEITIKSGEILVAEKLLNYLLAYIPKINNDNLTLAYLRTHIKYCEEIKKVDELLTLHERYYKIITQKNVELNAIKISNISMQTQYLRGIKEQKKLEEEVEYLKKQSEHDELTELPNRYLLNEYTKDYFNKAYKEKKNFGVIIIDVDHFKEYNDYYGHLGGDECLKVVADTLRKCCKEHFCARFGGDEFFIITYNIAEKDLFKIAIDIKNSVEKIELCQQDKIKNDTFSVSQGIAVGVPLEEHTFLDFWKAADVALFEGKRNGKNCISTGKVP